jgi:hypothetical protein
MRRDRQTFRWLDVPQWVTAWRIAGKYGYRRNLVSGALSAFWERFWLCLVHGKHHEKFDSHGACYRCGKAIR